MLAGQGPKGCFVLRMICALLGTMIAACCSTASAQQPIALRLGFNANSARNIGEVPNAVAARYGFFGREGLAVTMVPLKGTTHMVAALDAGEVDATGTATPYMIEAALQGSDAVAVIGGVANPMYSLIARPGIKSVADLKGKLVALSAPPDTITLSTKMLLAKGGLHDGDYRFKEIIGSAQRAACLVSGDCDAVPLSQPEDVVLARQGFLKLGDSLEVVPNLQFNVIAARRAWAAAHQAAMVALARAFGATFRFLRDPAHRDEAVAAIVDTTGADAAAARAILALYYEPDRGVMPRQGEISMSGMAAVIALLGSAGRIQPPLPGAERFVDLRYLHEAGLQ